MARISYGEQLAIAPQCSFAPGYALAVVIPARRFKVVAGQQQPSTLGAKILQTSASSVTPQKAHSKWDR